MVTPPGSLTVVVQCVHAMRTVYRPLDGRPTELRHVWGGVGLARLELEAVLRIAMLFQLALAVTEAKSV